MNKAWVGLEMAPAGSLKKKIHGLVWFLFTVSPTIFVSWGFCR